MNDDNDTVLPEFFPPVKDLKYKVGQGGLSKDSLARAQRVIDNNDVDFVSLATPYLAVLGDAVSNAQNNQSGDQEELIEGILFPTMHLKANGALFHYPIVSHIANKLLWFLERIYKLNTDALDIVIAFQDSVDLVFKLKLRGDVTKAGEKIMEELDGVCARYFEKYPDNVHPRILGKDS